MNNINESPAIREVRRMLVDEHLVNIAYWHTTQDQPDNEMLAYEFMLSEHTINVLEDVIERIETAEATHASINL